MEHSKLPFEHCAVIGGWDGIKDADGCIIANLVANVPENATFIATACNEHDTLKATAALHDELVGCCEGVLDFLEYRKDDLKHLGEAEVRRQILRRVLAKAKEIKCPSNPT